MSLRDIVIWPDRRLATACADVTDITDDLRSLAAYMLDTMYAAPGRGLAAPQVGEMLRLFVMDTGWKEGAPTPRVFVNPQILSRSEQVATRGEGCLSIPGVTAEVTRPERISLRWSDLDGVIYTETLDGFDAACAQHEIDHLDGIVTLDRLDDAERAEILADYGTARA